MEFRRVLFRSTRGVRKIHGTRRTKATTKAGPILADWSNDASSAKASAIKSQNAVTSHQKLEKRQRCGLETEPLSGTLGCIGGSSIFPPRDGVELTELSRIVSTLRERPCEVTRPPRFSSQDSPHLSSFVPASSHSVNLCFSLGVLISECRTITHEQLPATPYSGELLQVLGSECSRAH